MSNTAKTDYMEYPLVYACLHDLDCTPRGITSNETTMIHQSVNKHLISEFAADKSGDIPETAICKVLNKLGPVEAVTTDLMGKDTDAMEPVMGKSYILLISALIAVSALLVPFGVGFSMLLSVLTIILITKLSPSQARGILLIVNATVLAMALVHLILAFITVGALMETVHSSGGF